MVRHAFITKITTCILLCGNFVTRTRSNEHLQTNSNVQRLIGELADALGDKEARNLIHTFQTCFGNNLQQISCVVNSQNIAVQSIADEQQYIKHRKMLRNRNEEDSSDVTYQQKENENLAEDSNSFVNRQHIEIEEKLVDRGDEVQHEVEGLLNEAQNSVEEFKFDIPSVKQAKQHHANSEQVHGKSKAGGGLHRVNKHTLLQKNNILEAHETSNTAHSNGGNVNNINNNNNKDNNGISTELFRRSNKLSDKRELARLRKAMVLLRARHESETAKLEAVRRGVGELVASLKGSKQRLAKAREKNNVMGAELNNLHNQVAAAARLDQDLLEIQEHAKVNYETGEIEFAEANGRLSHLTVDQIIARAGGGNDASVSVAASGKLASTGSHNLMPGRGVVGSDMALFMANTNKNFADPAILHADLDLLLDIVVLLCAAALGGMLTTVVRMPPIIGYILGGVVVGPSGCALIGAVVQVETLAQFGSIFFLFAHGTEFSFKAQREFRGVAFGGCLLSMSLCTVLVQLFALYTKIASTPLEGSLIGLSSSLSSISIVSDFIHEDHLLQSSHGNVMVGMLAAQGLMMGLCFSIPPALSGGAISVGGLGLALGRAVLGVVFLVTPAFVLARRIVPSVLRYLSDRGESGDELFFLGVVSLALIMSLLTEFLGLSLDLGAFFAGLIIADTPFMTRAQEAVKPLASVFAAMLFASIGMIINPMFFWSHIVEICGAVANIMLVKFVVVVLAVRIFNYPWSTTLITGCGLAHIGELSLLFSSKLQAHMLLSRRAYLVYLTATVTTLMISPMLLKIMRGLPNYRRVAHLKK